MWGDFLKSFDSESIKGFVISCFFNMFSLDGCSWEVW